MRSIASDIDEPAFDEHAVDGEYAVVRSPLNRGGAALLYFLVLYFFSDDAYLASGLKLRIALPILLGFVLAGLGLALYGLRRDTTKFPAQLAVLLHVGAVLWIVVPVVAFFFVLWF